MTSAALRLIARPALVSVSLALAAPVGAQETAPQGVTASAGAVWVQIEAQPDLAVAQERAGAWAAVFPDVQGFDVGGGWYAIALGPYDQTGAEARLNQLKAENLIPGDSFLAKGAELGAMFWPQPGDAPSGLLGAVAQEPTAEVAPEPEPEAVIAPPALADETPDEARASEELLTQTERQDLQTALAWFGHYDSTIDGAFGRGTRASMAAWQQAEGFDPTGILTTRQRDALLTAWRDETRAFGFQTISEPEAGIEVTIPAALVEFDHYEPPFVHFRAKDGSDTRLILISTPGTGATLSGLYDTLQTLQIMPATGPRELTEDTFTLRGENADVITVAEARADRGAVKGWMFSFPAADAPRMERVLETLRASFRGVGDKALDPGLVPLDDSARQGLLAGLELRHAKLSRSGFYVAADGAVLTVAEAVDQCGRILLDGVTEATLAHADPATGLAVVKPLTPLAPPVFAGFSAQLPPRGAEVAAAGYSYEDRLSAPVLTYGRLAEAGGLNGETGLNRLSMTVLPGDAGGPVLAADGGVMGVVLPRAAANGKVLPGDVAYAADPATLVDVLAKAGVTAAPSTTTATMSPDALTRQAMQMTVLVSCYE